MIRIGGIPHMSVEDQIFIPQNFKKVWTIEEDNIASLKLQTNLM